MYSEQLKELINNFLKRNITAQEFEVEYIKIWRKYRDIEDKSNIPIEKQRYFDYVFSYVDSYCSQPYLRGENDIDEIQLFNAIMNLQ